MTTGQGGEVGEGGGHVEAMLGRKTEDEVQNGQKHGEMRNFLKMSWPVLFSISEDRLPTGPTGANTSICKGLGVAGKSCREVWRDIKGPEWRIC